MIFSVKHTVQLKVGVATHLSWAVVREGGAAAGQAAPAAEVLQLTEGDRVSIACVAAPGYPVMQFGWEHRLLQQEQNTTRARVGREYQVEYWMDNWTVSDVTGHAGVIGQYLANAIISDKSK